MGATGFAQTGGPIPLSGDPQEVPMNRRGWWVVAALTIALVAGGFGTAGQDKTRNPFKVTDVSDPDGKDVKEFADKAKLAGDAKDANAAQWAVKETDGKAGSIDGEGYSRWNGGPAVAEWRNGKAQVKTVGDRVYILYTEGPGTYLIDAKRDGKNRLVGRYVNTADENDSTPWVGVIVDDG